MDAHLIRLVQLRKCKSHLMNAGNSATTERRIKKPVCQGYKFLENILKLEEIVELWLILAPGGNRQSSHRRKEVILGISGGKTSVQGTCCDFSLLLPRGPPTRPQGAVTPAREGRPDFPDSFSPAWLQCQSRIIPMRNCHFYSDVLPTLLPALLVNSGQNGTYFDGGERNPGRNMGCIPSPAKFCLLSVWNLVKRIKQRTRQDRVKSHTSLFPSHRFKRKKEQTLSDKWDSCRLERPHSIPPHYYPRAPQLNTPQRGGCKSCLSWCPTSSFCLLFTLPLLGSQ